MHEFAELVASPEFKIAVARQYDHEPPSGWGWIYNAVSTSAINPPFAKAKPNDPEGGYTSEQLIQMGLVGVYRESTWMPILT